MAYVTRRYWNSGCLFMSVVIICSFVYAYCAKDTLKEVFLKTVTKEHSYSQVKGQTSDEQVNDINNEDETSTVNINKTDGKIKKNVFDTLKVVLKKVKDEVKNDSRNKVSSSSERESSEPPSSSYSSEDSESSSSEKIISAEEPDHKDSETLENSKSSIYQYSKEQIAPKKSYSKLYSPFEVFLFKKGESGKKGKDQPPKREKRKLEEERELNGRLENTPQRGTSSFDTSELSSSGTSSKTFVNETLVDELMGSAERVPQKSSRKIMGDGEVKIDPETPSGDGLSAHDYNETKTADVTEEDSSKRSTNDTATQTSEDKEESSEESTSGSVVLPPETISDSLKEKDQLETYSQFAERVLAEKKNGGGSGASPSGGNGQISKGPKVKSKNYASTDCGAKFLGANPQASHSHKIINSNKDEYMLNTCTEKIWVTIELCESIRPQKFDIANFELFSNLPKDIRLYGGHRYPSREWVSLGMYVGEEGNREVQSFHVETQEFFKFIKLEVHSHYGTEFFCPLSLFRIYGLSEFEVIEEGDDSDEGEEEQILEEEFQAAEANRSEGTKEKQGFTIQAVIKSVVNDVLEVIKRGSRSGNITNQPELNSLTQGCRSLDSNFTIKKEFCSFADSLNYILACYYEEYLKLIENPFLSYVIQNNYFCQQLANLICTSSQNSDSYVYDSVCNNSYVCVMLSPKHVLAMCHMNDPSFLNFNMSCEEEESQPKNVSTTKDSSVAKEPDAKVLDPTSYIKEEKLASEVDDEGIKSNASVNASNLEDEIAVATKEKETVIHLPYIDPKDKVVDGGGKDSSPQHPEKPSNASSNSSSKTEKTEATEKKKDKKVDKDSSEKAKQSDEPGIAPGSPTVAPPTTAVPPSSEGRISSHSNKESVVVRLSNKIKVLEHNMSISSQYLEELSRRYKRQMEDMQRQFNITILALNSTSQTAYERDIYHQKRLESLELQLEKLTEKVSLLVEEKENLLMNVIEQHMILLFIEVCVMCLVFSFCLKRRKEEASNTTYRMNSKGIFNTDERVAEDGSSLGDHQGRETPSLNRRRSVDSIKTENEPKPRERRYSGQMQVAGSYKDLMLGEATTKEKKKKKKSSGLERSLSNASIHESKRSSSAPSKKEKKLEKLRKSSAGVIFSGEKKDSHLSRIDSPRKHETVEEIGRDEWHIVKRNKKSRGESSTITYSEEQQPYVLSSDLKRGKITIVEEPLCNVYQQQYFTEILYDPDYDVYGKEYLEVGQYEDGASSLVNPGTDVYSQNIEGNNSFVSYYCNGVNDDILNPQSEYPVSHWDPNTLSSKPLVKTYRSPSSTNQSAAAFKGKPRLRSDNWEWYSSQQSRLLPKSTSTEVLSNSSSDSGTKSKGTKVDSATFKYPDNAKHERKKKKKNKLSKMTNGESH